MVTRAYKKTHQSDKLFHNKKHTPIHQKIYPISLPNITVQTKPICPCDGGCPRCRSIQPKLKTGKPDDKYEQEADRVADQVMKMPDPEKVQQKAGCSSCIDTKEEEPEENNLQTTPISQQITPIIQRQDEPEDEEAQMPETGEIPEEAETPEEEEEEPVERKAEHNKAPLVSPALQSRIYSLKGGGPASTRTCP